MAKQLRNRLIYHLHDTQLRRAAVTHAHGRLIDIGCGTKPYAELFADQVDEHVGVDHEASLHDTSQVDLFGT